MASNSNSSSTSSKLKKGYRCYGRRGSSSSSSSYVHSYLCEDSVPKRACLWKKQHLEFQGIFYDERPSSTAEILAVVKKQVVDLHMEELPDIGQKLIELTKRIFNFSFNFNLPVNSEINLRKLWSEIERTCSDFESHMTDFKSQNHGLLQDRINERVFQNWVTYASEFLSYLRIFTVSYQMLETREATYTQLLTQFMRLCLLVPERGDSLLSTLKIKGRRVSGIPDVRFPSHEKGDSKTINVVTVAEVKQSDAFRGNTDNIDIGHFTDGVLGRHGAQLLLENYKSFFRPAITGLVCMGTKIALALTECNRRSTGKLQSEHFNLDNLMFTVLEIDGVKYASLQQADGVEKTDSKLTILYSKPYDYMDSCDRNDIFEICFWFGYVQHDAYKSVIP